MTQVSESVYNSAILADFGFDCIEGAKSQVLYQTVRVACNTRGCCNMLALLQSIRTTTVLALEPLVH